MGLFSKKPQPIPRITIEGLPVFYHPDSPGWDFRYRDTDFVTYQPHFVMPSQPELDEILADLTALTPEMRTRIARQWAHSKPPVNLDEDVSYQINLDQFHEAQAFSVLWSGGDTWGDMGVEFIIKARQIVEEFWGD